MRNFYPAQIVAVFLLLGTWATALPLAYVVNNGSRVITVVDMGTRQVVGQINVGDQPSELYILPDNRFALLTEYGGNTLRKIDLRALGSVSTVTVGEGPGSLTVSPDSRLAYVANDISNDVSVVDVPTMSQLTRIPVGTSPIQVNQRPDGRFVYALNADDNSVSVIDTGARAVVSTVATGLRPNQFAVHPTGLRAFIPNRGSNTVSVFDLNSNSITRTITVPGREPGIIQFSPDGGRIFVLNRASGTVDVIDNASLSVVISFTVGAEPTDIAITSDGLYAYIACFGSNQIWVADMTLLSRPGRPQVTADPLEMGAGSRPFTVAFDLNENFAFVVLLGGDQLAVIDTNTDQIVTRMTVGSAPVGFVQLNQPFVYPGGVVNGASFAQGAAVAGAAIVSIFGEGLVAEEDFASSLPLPTSLRGTQVRFNGVAAPLFFTSGLQINAQAPAALLGASSAQLEIIGPNGVDVSTVSLAPVSPGIFSFTSDGRGPGAILHDDSATPVTAANPARPGETVVIFATGLGQTNPPVREGVASAGAASTVAPVTATIGGQNAVVSYAGLAPGFAGLYQVNAVVPAGLSGTQNVFVRVAGAASNTVTIAIR